MTTNRAAVQGDRIRMVVGLRDSSVRRLHAELVKRGERVGVYETFRKQTRGKGQDLSYAMLKTISEITLSPLEWIAGNDGAEFDELTKGVYLTCPDSDCPNYVDAEGQCVRIDHCPLVLAVAA